MKILIISYTLEKVSSTQQSLIQNKLYGYRDHSNGNKYLYERKGLLDGLPHVKLNRGVIVVREKDGKAILSVLRKYKASVKVIKANADKSLIK